MYEFIKPRQRLGKNLFVKKEQRSQCLVLRRRGDVARGRKIGQERRYLRRAQFARAAFSRKKMKRLIQ
jgi:hypothetical protein